MGHVCSSMFSSVCVYMWLCACIRSDTECGEINFSECLMGHKIVQNHKTNASNCVMEHNNNNTTKTNVINCVMERKITTSQRGMSGIV
jgi:hypothetical protein